MSYTETSLTAEPGCECAAGRRGAGSRVPLRELLVVAVFGLVVFCFGLGWRNLWNPDEPRYARIAAEMIRSGDWINLRFNGEAYREKPPLYFWLIAGTTRLAGLSYPSAWTALLPSALSAILCLAALYWSARRHYGWRAAWLAVIITGTSAFFIWVGRRAQLDMVLTTVVTVSCLWLYESFLPGRSVWWSVAAGVAMGAIVLVKFHIYLPVLVGVVFLVFAHGRGGRRAWLRLGLATLIGLALSAWWLVLTMRSGTGPDLSYQLNRVGDWRGHEHGYFYFFYVVPMAFLPWTVYAVELAARRLQRGWLAYRQESEAEPLHGAASRLTAGWLYLRHAVRKARGAGDGLALFCGCWAVVVFVLFSLVQSKRSLYILPMLPALGLLTARGLSLRIRREHASAERGRMLSGRLIAAAALLLGYGLLVAGGVCLGMAHKYPWRQLVALGVTLLVLSGLVYVAARRSAAAGAVSIGLAMLVLLIVAASTFFPWLDRQKSARPFCEHVVAKVGESPRLAIYYQTKMGTLLYNFPTVDHIKPMDPVLLLDKDGDIREVEVARLRRMTRSQVERQGRAAGVSPRTWDRIYAFLEQPRSALIMEESKYRELPTDVRRRLTVLVAEPVSNDIYYALQLAGRQQ